MLRCLEVEFLSLSASCRSLNLNMCSTQADNNSRKLRLPVSLVRPRPKTIAARQKANKGPRRQTAAMSEEEEDNHERHRRVELRTEIAAGKRRNAQGDPM
jgi:hypothetical protein